MILSVISPRKKDVTIVDIRIKDVIYVPEEYIIDFFDGYKLEVDASANQNTFQFITPEGKNAKKFTEKKDPREISIKSAIGVEIKKHLEPEGRLRTKGVLEDEFEAIIIEMSDMVEEIVVAKNEADEILAKMEEQIEEDLILEGKQSLNTTEHPLVWVGNVVDWLTAGERMNILYAWIAYCSQVILKNPISVIALGEGGSGKTHIEDVAMSLIPSQYVMNMKSSTMAAVYAMADKDPYHFDGKIVNMGDLGGSSDHEEAEEFKNIMKEMQSDGYVKRIKMVKGEDGEQIPKEFELYGNPCITFTSVPGHDFDDQEMSRSIMITPRDDNNMAVGKYKHLARSKNNRSARNIQEYKDKVPTIQNMVLALRDRMDGVEIYNPYASFMDHFLAKTKYFKRDVDKYDGILRVITALNGYHRNMYEDSFGKTLFTTKNDIYYFLDLLSRYHESIATNLSPAAADVLTILRDNAEEWDLYEEGITANDFMFNTNTNLSKRSVQQYFSEMNASGALRVSGKDGRSNVYILVDTNFSGFKDKVELSVDDIQMLEYNYGLDNLSEYETEKNYFPPETVWETAKAPFWNKFLPENRRQEDGQNSIHE